MLIAGLLKILLAQFFGAVADSAPGISTMLLGGVESMLLARMERAAGLNLVEPMDEEPLDRLEVVVVTDEAATAAVGPGRERLRDLDLLCEKSNSIRSESPES